MGSVEGEDLMQGSTGSEERIYVSVRLRPLNEKELARNEVSDWECINDNTIIYRNGLSVSERSMYPTAYAFDRVFNCDCSTRKVYEEGAKEVALSVVSGINSTVFAYGQTSSGKTFTMSGITEYTVADIYEYIEKHLEREFLLKLSALEIYNESVRDLLSADSTPLRLLDDPEKGTTVEKLTEETLSDWNHFKELLSVCEAQRQVGETSLNEASSRSHQIIRLTIESSAREFLGKDRSSSLSATVNFVDLAGSERASQSMSAGARLKEGCHINRSLLTLGTVIRKLSKGRNGHIPFRDSKLTRILQSSLGGNARTAIICTMSPARTLVEQSRNTLLFASCAKEVATNAHVNVVVSDKALVKKLQRELARLENELRSSGKTPSVSDSSALLKEKDLEIQKLKEEIKELTIQRDLAQGQVKDLINVVRDDETSVASESVGNYYPKLRVRATWTETQGSAIPIVVDTRGLEVRAGSFDASQYSDGQSSISEDNFLHLNEFEDHSEINSSPQVAARVPTSTEREKYVEETEQSNGYLDDHCKEVRCIEIEESHEGRYDVSTMQDSSPNRYIDSNLSSPVTNTVTSASTGVENAEREIRELESLPLKEAKQSNRYDQIFVVPSPEKTSPWIMEGEMLSSSGLKLTRSRSCKARLMTSFSSGKPESIDYAPSWCEDFKRRFEDLHDSLPALGFDSQTEKLSRNGSRTVELSRNGSPTEELSRNGSPTEELSRNGSHAELSRNGSQTELSRSGSQTSFGSSAAHEPKERKTNTTVDDKSVDISSQIAGTEQFPEAEGHDQLVETVELQTELKPTGSSKSVKDVGLDPIQDDAESPSTWPLEFTRLQREIIELWHACNISLVHRTYFFLLFKGDPSDSIYMEVERRRLSFLKDTFSRGDQTVEDGRTLTPESSLRALGRERQMLCKQMSKKLSSQERESLFIKWGIHLDSSNRRLQLAHRLWTNAKSMDHIKDSAAIVAKLVRYVQPEQAFKEMFGLNFTPHRTSPRFLGWRPAAFL